jgi:hypothetical protein
MSGNTSGDPDQNQCRNAGMQECRNAGYWMMDAGCWLCGCDKGYWELITL